MPVPAENPRDRGGLSPFESSECLIAMPGDPSRTWTLGRVYDAAGNKVSLAEQAPILDLLSFI
jgi:hypothetical protein